MDIANSTSTGFSQVLINTKAATFIAIVCIGIIANSLSFFIIIKRSLIKGSVGVYLACLSISDSWALIASFMYDFSKEPFNLPILNNSDFGCKFSLSSYLWSGVISHFILTTMTCERCYIILNPYKPHPKRKHAGIAVATIVVISITFYVAQTSIINGLQPVQIVSDSNNQSNVSEITYVCDVLEEHLYYFNNVFPWIDLLVFSVIPSSTIILANIGIVVALIRRSKNKQVKRDQTKIKEDMKITYMLISVSIFFVLVTLPYSLYNSFGPVYFYDGPVEAFAFDNIAWTFVFNILLLNYSCNFFLYFCSGKIFRDEAIQLFKEIFRCKQNERNAQT